MLRTIFFSFIVTSVLAVDQWNNFVDFMKRHEKFYDTLKILETRYQYYKENMEFAMQHNALQSNYTLGETEFADLSLEEFRQRKNPSYSLTKSTSCETFSKWSSDSVPKSIDWRELGAVTEVKDQGQCGSCWSFSATGAMEGAWQITNGELISLSEQQLVDCASGFKYGNHGCNGGLMDGAFQYAIDNGMCSEQEYPYFAKGTSCQSCDSLVRIESCVDVTPRNEIDLEMAASKGPISVAIEADTRVFQLYNGGVLTDSACGTNLDHGVLIVGYGTTTDDHTDYWIVKNSWGNSWGENGYIRIGKSADTNTAGICGIALQPSYPVV
jgi:C1A family cysteine protease